MTKTIDITKPIGGPSIAPSKKPPVEKPAAENNATPATKKGTARARAPLGTSFLSVFLAIAVNDVRYKLGLAPGPLPELQKKIEDREKYNAFCKLARGER